MKMQILMNIKLYACLFLLFMVDQISNMKESTIIFAILELNN